MQGAIRLKNRDNRFFLKAVAFSLLLHVVIISVSAVMFRRGAKDIYISPAYTVNLVGQAPARPATDVVAGNAKALARTPEKSKATTPAKTTSSAIKKTKAEKGAKKATAEKALSTVESAVKRIEHKLEKNAAERLSSRASDRGALDEKIEKIRKDIRTRGTNRNSVDGRASANGSKAGAAVNAGLSMATLESNHPAYYSAITERVQSNWAFPEARDNRELSVIVSIRIKRDGGLLDAWVEKTSGSALFDESLLNAVRRASPFPPLPDGFSGNFLETGLRFCPNCSR